MLWKFPSLETPVFVQKSFIFMADTEMVLDLAVPSVAESSTISLRCIIHCCWKRAIKIKETGTLSHFFNTPISFFLLQEFPSENQCFCRSARIIGSSEIPGGIIIPGKSSILHFYESTYQTWFYQPSHGRSLNSKSLLLCSYKTRPIWMPIFPNRKHFSNVWHLSDIRGEHSYFFMWSFLTRKCFLSFKKITWNILSFH